MTEKITKANKVLGVFTLAMINVALICSLRGLPMMAEYGLSIVFFLLVAVLLFLVPVSLVSAELATAWPKRGGLYAWVRQAFGEKWGFIAICLQWVQNLVFYPTALAATAAVIAYLINPALAENKFFTLGIILVVYWGALLINFRGMKLSGMISTIGTMLGIILPGAILIILALLWLFTGEASQITFNLKGLIPDLSNIQNIVFLTGMFLFFAGMEVSGVHALEVHNPQKDYPKAIFVSALMVIAIFLLGSLSIAIILPHSEISLTAGIMQTFYAVFNKFHMLWAIPIIAILAAPGMIVQVSTWIAGPSRGLLATAQNGDLPPLFQYMNKNHMPTHIMIFQGIIVSIISLVFLFMPSVSSSFWILTDLAALLYLSVYIIMFLAAIKLRYSEPNTLRPYKVPGGNAGMWIFAGLGILACLSAIILGFIPPAQLPSGNLMFYELFLSIGFIALMSFPFIIFRLRKPSWKKKIEFE
ncbi:MAG: amino acid permease [Patescibacteria group bacterium]|nr:amino acid permease [Patescibacteria group bacterium]